MLFLFVTIKTSIMKLLVYHGNNNTLQWIDRQVKKLPNYSFIMKANSVAEVQILISSVSLDAIIYDISNDGASCHEILSGLIGVHGKIPVIVVTDILHISEAMDTINDGANTFMIKEVVKDDGLVKYLNIKESLYGKYAGA